MKSFSRYFATFTFLATVAAMTAVRADQNDGEYEQHHAHVHGEAKLLITVEGRILQMQFISPAMNIVGFEHQAETEKQKQAVTQAEARLKQAQQLFAIFPAAGCELNRVELVTALSHEEHEQHEEHMHGQESEGAESHSDFSVEYEFHCAQPALLRQITVRIFEWFPATRHIDVQSISQQGQHHSELDAGNNRITFE